MTPTRTSVGRNSAEEPNHATEVASSRVAPCRVHGATFHQNPGSRCGSRPDINGPARNRNSVLASATPIGPNSTSRATVETAAAYVPTNPSAHQAPKEP